MYFLLGGYFRCLLLPKTLYPHSKKEQTKKQGWSQKRRQFTSEVKRLEDIQQIKGEVRLQQPLIL